MFFKPVAYKEYEVIYSQDDCDILGISHPFSTFCTIIFYRGIFNIRRIKKDDKDSITSQIRRDIMFWKELGELPKDAIKLQEGEQK
jgi:hypothetical protein